MTEKKVENLTRLASGYLSPYRIVLILAVIVFSSEAIIMVLLSFQPSQPTWFVALLDSLLLVAMLSPALYFFLFKPILLDKAWNMSILESIPEMLFILNTEGVFMGFKAMKGMETLMPPEEFIGKKASDLLPTRLEEETLRHIELALKTETTQLFEYELPLKGILHNYEAKIARISVDEVLCIVRDITEHKKAEEKIKQHEVHLEDMLELHRLGNSTEKEVLDFTLEASLRSLQSEFAFVGIMSADEAVMIVHKWSNGAMKQCAVIDNPLVFIIAETGLLGEAVRQRGTIIVNDYKTSQLFKKGYPDGHVPIKRFLSIPVFRGKRIVAIAAVANKVSEYTESDVTSFTSFLNEMWSILDYQETRKEIRKSLEEKEVLLREIHHRVKNNMQVVASLLNLQSQNIEDKKYKDVFIDSRNRIYAMALIHEKLYQSESLAQINIKEYIEGIVSNIFESYGQKSNIRFDINIENVPINLDYAVPCGLIINELLTNSFKYGFPDGRQGIIKISVKLNDNNMIQLSISDNGIGIPKDLDIRNTKSLGLKLVISLAEGQLHGTIILNRERGIEFQINFRHECMKTDSDR